MNKSQIFSLLKKFDIKKFLQGPKISNKLIPAKTSGSGFAVFLTKKPSILKILWDPKFSYRLQNELFVYQQFKQNNRYLPKLLSFSTTLPKFLEIEYLTGFSPIGSLHKTIFITEKILNKTIQVISYFHTKVASKTLKELRNLDFYQKKLFQKDSGIRLKKYFGISPEEFVKKLIKQKSSINNNLSFVLSDRNPGNILIDKNNQIKLIDFDRCGMGNPAGDYTFLFLTLVPKYNNLTKILLKLLKKNYQSILFWNYFYLDIAFRCIDEYHFWKKNLSVSQKIKTLFLKFYSKI